MTKQKQKSTDRHLSGNRDLQSVKLNCIAALPIGTFELSIYVTTEDESAEPWNSNENLGAYADLPWVANAVRSIHEREAWGLFNIAVPCIIIDGRVPAARFRATLLHELGHALEHLLGLTHTEGQANVIGLFLDAFVENVVDLVEQPGSKWILPAAASGAGSSLDAACSLLTGASTMEDSMNNKRKERTGERLYIGEREIKSNLFVAQSQGWARRSRLLTSDELAQQVPISLPSLFDANGGEDE
jgi:hypothetical protein